MYTINVSHVYVLIYTIPGYGNYKLGTKLNGRLKIMSITVGCIIISYFSMDSGSILLDLISRHRIPSKTPKRRLAA